MQNSMRKISGPHTVSMEMVIRIIIFRYLLTVENWFRRPELYHYQFSTIAWHAMSSALHNDTQKKRRQIQTVSLDDMIPGCEDLTWGDVITEKNLEYVPYAEVS